MLPEGKQRAGIQKSRVRSAAIWARHMAGGFNAQGESFHSNVASKHAVPSKHIGVGKARGLEQIELEGSDRGESFLSI